MAKLTFRPLTSAHGDAFEELFRPRRACCGCWCMWWRMPALGSTHKRERGTDGQ